VRASPEGIDQGSTESHPTRKMSHAGQALPPPVFSLSQRGRVRVREKVCEVLRRENATGGSDRSPSPQPSPAGRGSRQGASRRSSSAPPPPSSPAGRKDFAVRAAKNETNTDRKKTFSGEWKNISEMLIEMTPLNPITICESLSCSEGAGFSHGLAETGLGCPLSGGGNRLALRGEALASPGLLPSAAGPKREALAAGIAAGQGGDAAAGWAGDEDGGAGVALSGCAAFLPRIQTSAWCVAE
jgi:hypothetical protein